MKVKEMPILEEILTSLKRIEEKLDCVLNNTKCTECFKYFKHTHHALLNDGREKHFCEACLKKREELCKFDPYLFSHEELIQRIIP